MLTNDADVTDDGETVAREPLCSPVLQALTGHKLPEAPGVGLRLPAKNLYYKQCVPDPEHCLQIETKMNTKKGTIS